MKRLLLVGIIMILSLPLVANATTVPTLTIDATVAGEPVTVSGCGYEGTEVTYAIYKSNEKGGSDNGWYWTNYSDEPGVPLVDGCFSHTEFVPLTRGSYKILVFWNNWQGDLRSGFNVR